MSADLSLSRVDGHWRIAWLILLWNRAECPPLHRPDGTHDVALALSGEAGGGRRLAHSGYGWWAVAPVGMFPERVVATKGGLSFDGEEEERDIREV